jgi:hypothetical protein
MEKCWCVSQKGRTSYEEVDVGGKMTLKWISEKWDDIDWIHLAKDRNQW